MAHSGARGGIEQIRQLAGMRGLMAKPNGTIIETPIKANFREGLSVLEYFSSHARCPQGSGRHRSQDGRLGLPDPQARRRGPERRHHHARLRHHPGHQPRASCTRARRSSGPLAESIRGRVSRNSITDPRDDEVIVDENEMITWDGPARSRVWASTRFLVRSPDDLPGGAWASAGCCYGMDLATGNLVEEGMAVGIIAAQSIGEPGTQLTMRTFHIGGVVKRDIVERVRSRPRRPAPFKFERINAVINDKGEQRSP